jgi:hypothetical protein
MGDAIASMGDENLGKSKVAVPSSKWMSPESPSESSSSLLRFGGESSIGSKSIFVSSADDAEEMRGRRLERRVGSERLKGANV